MTISRRKFIQTGTLASASLMIPSFLKGFEYRTDIPVPSNKILVVVQLSGGNDGLNTVIPFRNDIYYSQRQKISINTDAVLKFNDEIGLNPALKGLRRLYDDGRVSILNGVGYPQPNRSHFRSMEIWQTGSSANENIDTGWIGRYLDNTKPERNIHSTIALEIDDALSLALKGEETNAIAIRDINQFYKATSNSFFKNLASHSEEHNEKLAGYLYKTLRESTAAADYVYEKSKIYSSAQTYPDTPLGKRMKTIGSLIVSNADTRIYYVSHDGFDTHVNQNERQNKLLGQLDDALIALHTDLKTNNRADDVLIMVFSEFGRRVAQNASNGTDHGTANNMLFIGGGLKKPGLYNNIPSLTDLDEGDLKYQIDFRQTYATVLDKWLQTNSKNILYKKFELLDFI